MNVSISAALLQDRLDVRSKSRVNLFNWRGQFTPEFVGYLLESFAFPSNVIIDPFAGSGTVLHECSTRQLECYGYEINPAAYAMCKFFTFANIPPAARRTFLAAVEEQIINSLEPYRNLPLLSDSCEFRERYSSLLSFAKELLPLLATKEEKVLAVNILLIAECRNKKTLGRTILNAFDYLTKGVLGLPYTRTQLGARLGDARLVHERHANRADIILTSPPYINVFNYHQNHRAILEGMGWDLLHVAQSEIGSNRKNRANRFRTVIQYCLEMEEALASIWKCLKPNGTAILVVGRESNVRRIPFYNGLLIKEIMGDLEGFAEISNYERQFTNRFGINIKEDIIVARKAGPIRQEGVGRAVALKHLNLALDRATEDVREDLLDAISGGSAIKASPVFTRKEIFADA